MSSPVHQTILVTGAGGFIGKVVVNALLQRGWRVKAMMRTTRPCPAEVIIADMRDAGSLRTALTGCTAVVHLAAAKSDEPDSDDVNIEGAKRLVEACRAAGCRRIINMSTQSAKIVRKGAYARTKSAADEIFHASGLDVTTLMPSVVYGDEKTGVFGTVLTFIEKLPVVPVLGDGQWISAPVHVDDVAGAIVACLDHNKTVGKRYDIAGPDQLTFDALIDKLGAGIGKRRPKLHIPVGLALFIANIVAKLLPKPPITVSNVLGSNQNTDIDIEPARRDFGFNPVGLDAGLKRVLDDPEACRLARYLLGVTPSRELQTRYATARAKLLGDDAEWRFVCRHPWTLPFVDAASSLLRPQSSVRQRIFLMAAVLETTPDYADFFLTTPSPATLVWQGLRATAKTAVGIPILALARRG